MNIPTYTLDSPMHRVTSCSSSTDTNTGMTFADRFETTLLDLLSRPYSDSEKIAQHVNECFIEEKENLLETFNAFETKYQEKSHDNDCLLLYLIEHNCQEAALKLINLGISTINSQAGYCKKTPLHAAAEKGQIEIVKALVAKGANVNATYTAPGFKETAATQISPLSACFSHSDSSYIDFEETYKKIFCFLLEHQADPNTAYVTQMPILNYCLKHSYYDLAELIIDRVDINAKDILGVTPLHFAVWNLNREWTERLLKKGADVNQLGNMGGIVGMKMYSPLHIAVHYQNLELTQLLLSHGADPNLKSENENLAKLFKTVHLTPYQLAVDLNSDECMCAIVQSAEERGIALDTHYPGERSFLGAESLKEASRKGYASLPLRLKTQQLKAKGEIQGIALRCYSESTTSEFVIRQALKTLDKDLGVAEKCCRPFFDLLIKVCEQNENFGIYCLDTYQAQGCYNKDTGEELVINMNTTDAKWFLYTLVHEAAHKAADLLYKTYNNAPPSTSPFFQALEEDLKNLENATNDYVKILFYDIHKHYDETKHPSEYLVRIPQAILMTALNHPELSWEELEADFNASIPNLFSFFMNDFLENCQEYISGSHVSSIIGQ